MMQQQAGVCELEVMIHSMIIRINYILVIANNDIA